MAIEVFFGPSMADELPSGAFEYLLVKWTMLRDTNALTFQRLFDETPYPIKHNLICLLPTPTDFVYMYCGQMIQQAGKSDPTGTLLSDRGDAIIPDLARTYRRSGNEAIPAFIRFTSSLTANADVCARIVLPIPVGDTVLIACYSEFTNHRSEVYDYLFQTDPSSLMIAQPIFDESSRIDDGWILQISDKARAKLSHRGSIGNFRMREFEPFRSDDFWFALRNAQTLAKPRAKFAFGNTPYELIRFKHVLALRFF